MTTILPQPNARSYSRSHSVKIDMTPMVDLGFLLITFFIFTTTMAEPRVTKLIIPADGKGIGVPETKAFTAILDKDKVYLYGGQFHSAKSSNAIVTTGYDVTTGLGNFIRQKQNELEQKGLKGELVFIVKPLASASYQNVVNALDEVLINRIQYYAITDVTNEEESFTKAKQ